MKNRKSSDGFWGRGTIRIPKGSHLPKCQARGVAGEGVTRRGCQSRVGVALSVQCLPPVPLLAVSKGWRVTMVVEGGRGPRQGGDQSGLGRVRRQRLPRTPPELEGHRDSRAQRGVFSPGHL